MYVEDDGSGKRGIEGSDLADLARSAALDSPQ
jgi:hypothetical protein